MKKITFILLLVVGIAYSGCKDGGGTSADSIVGKWKITDVELNLKDMPEDSEEMMAMVKKAILKSEYQYKKDGTYSMSAMGYTAKGTWTYDAEKKHITLKSEEGKSSENIFQIQSGDKDNMVILNEKETDGSVTLTFARIKEGDAKSDTKPEGESTEGETHTETETHEGE